MNLEPSILMAACKLRGERSGGGGESQSQNVFETLFIIFNNCSCQVGWRVKAGGGGLRPSLSMRESVKKHAA